MSVGPTVKKFVKDCRKVCGVIAWRPMHLLWPTRSDIGPENQLNPAAFLHCQIDALCHHFNKAFMYVCMYVCRPDSLELAA